MNEGHGNTYTVENPEDFEYPINLCYNGIQGLKKAGVKTELTHEQDLEFDRCMDDPIYFVEKYCKILHVDDGVIPFQPYEYQKKMIRNLIEHRYTINILPRQAGKTTIISAGLLWYAVFQPETPMAVLANKAGQAREILSRIKMMYEYLPWWMQVGVRKWNEGSIKLGNGSSIIADSTRGTSIRGKSMACVTGDTLITVLDVETGRQHDIRIDHYNQIEWGWKTKILSSKGFQDFDGIICNGFKMVKDYPEIGLTATPDHQILVNGEWKEIDVVYSGCNTRVEMVYDALNVAGGNEYLTNGTPSHNCVYLDEFAWIDNDVEFYTSVYPTITSGKKTKIIITSTPRGMNLFYKIWTEAENGKNAYHPFRVHWSEMPGRDQAWADEQIKNTSERQFEQEYLLSFQGSSDTLIAPNAIQRLTFRDPIQLLGDNRDFKVYETPVLGKSYVVTVDVSEGVGLDYSVISVFDVTEAPFKQVAMMRSNVIIPQLFAEMVFMVGMMYNEAVVIIETNNQGQIVVDDLWEMEYENILWTKDKKGVTKAQDGGKSTRPGVKTTTKTKAIGCSSLKALIESNQLIICDFETIQEISNFIKKRNSYEADKGYNDDIVMTLVMFAWFTAQPYFSDWTDINSKKAIRSSILDNDDFAPFMFLDDGLEENSSWLLS